MYPRKSANPFDALLLIASRGIIHVFSNQNSILTDYQFQTHPAAFIVQLAKRLVGTMGHIALERSLVASLLLLELPIIHLPELPKRQRIPEAARLANDQSQTRFDLAIGPLLRVLLVRLVEGQVILR